MKKLCVLLFFSVQLFAQTSMNVESFEINSPGEDQLFMRLEFLSHEPARIEECTIEFEDDRIFDFVDRLALHQDSSVLPVLSHASEFLFNPWTHYPGVYVGLAEDTTVVLDYKIDLYRYYSNFLHGTIECRLNYYGDPSAPDTIIGPIDFSSSSVLSVIEQGTVFQERYQYSIFDLLGRKVKSGDYGIYIKSPDH